jgi:hypothetical protein
MQEREALQNKFARFEADVVSIRACRLRSKHDPNVHLEMLIESFNDAGYSRPLRGKQKRELKKMASELDVLRAKLTTQDEVTALRLKAWITAKLEGLGEAHRFFEQSAQLAHENNMQAAELLTLTDWRRYYYASFSSGEFIDTQVILLGYPLNFLVIIEGRIRELANLSGFLPVETCCHAGVLGMR